MRRIIVGAAVALLLAGSALAASTAVGETVPGAPWVRMATEKQIASANADAKHLVPGLESRPSVLLETDYYVYGNAVGLTAPQVLLTLASNGYSSPATLYLYWQNRVTGERRYYNLSQGWLGEGETADLLGSGSPLPIWVPDLTSFELFGDTGAFGAAPTSPTGRYMFVLEVRDAAGDETLARGYALYSFVDQVITVSDDIVTDTTWTASNAYYLGAPIYVGAAQDVGSIDVTLTVEPGTVVFGSKQSQGTLVIYPGAEIMADGTPLQPIIFTSEQPVGERAPGDWGGLVLSGNAPVNDPSGHLEGEGSSGRFGGDDPMDSSGVLRYVRVEFAGIRFSEQNELNGIALQGVGRGTTIDHVQVHFNQDDGIELFGGTVDAKYLLLTDARDDSFDWVHGWTGRVQHVVVLQRHLKADNGIEADNFEDGPSFEPRSNPTIYNATFIGNANYVDPASEDSEYGQGAVLRRGTAGTLRNVIFTGFGLSGIRVDGSETHAQIAAGTLSIDSSIIQGNEQIEAGYSGSAGDAAAVEAFLWDGTRNQELDPMLANPYASIQPDVSPLPGSPARRGSFVASPPDDGFFEPVDYIGGVNPSNPWIWEPWTTFSDN